MGKKTILQLQGVQLAQSHVLEHLATGPDRVESINHLLERVASDALRLGWRLGWLLEVGLRLDLQMLAQLLLDDRAHVDDRVEGGHVLVGQRLGERILKLGLGLLVEDVLHGVDRAEDDLDEVTVRAFQKVNF